MKDILELGSGCGLASLCCALMGAKSVIMTDHDPQVLDLLQSNIGLNTMKISDCKISTRGLDWENFSQSELADLHNRFIIGADLVYDSSLIKPLVNILFCLLEKSPAAYIASTVRNPSTFESFVQELDEMGVSKEFCQNSKPLLFEIIDDQRVEILKLWRNKN